MATVGRLKDGDLLLTGEVNERLPVVTSGLVTHFPMDGTTQGVSRKNKLDTSQWKVGTSGSQGTFSQNGDGNSVIMYQNPWGYEEPTWGMLGNDAGSDADGGWNYYGVPIDHTKKYRLSVWVRRENVGDGRTYFGCQGSTVCNLGTTTVNTNPYFISRIISERPELANNWTLWVAYIHPSDYVGGNDSTNGIYTADGIRLQGITDYKWEAGETVGGHRAYMYYSTATTERQYFARPRMEVCDGTEASIQDLLNDRDDITYETSSSNLVIRDEHIAVEEATTNTWAGGFTIYNNFGQPASLTQLDETYMGEPVYRLGFTVTDPARLASFQNDLSSHGVYGGSQSWVQDTYYVSSVYWRPVNKADTQFGGTASNTGGWNTGTNTKQPDGWIRYYRWRTGAGVATKSDSVHHSFCCPSLQLNETIYIDVCCPQTEQGRIFPTSYVNGSKSAGTVEVPVRTGADFTIAYKFTPNIDWAQTPNFSGNREMWDLYDKNTGKKVWLYDYKGTAGQTTTAPWIGFDQFVTNAYSPWHWHTPALNWRANKEYYFVLTKSGATWTKYWLDEAGHQIQSATHTDAALIAFVPDRLVFLSGYNCRIKDLSIYDRALTNDEIKKWYGGAYDMTSSGHLITNRVKEKPNGIPADSIHIPLDMSTKDRLNYLAASEEANTVYRDGSVWVGTALTNLYPQSDSNDDFIKGNGIFTVKNTGDTVEYTYEYNQNLTWTYHGRAIAITSGTQYRASMEVRISEDANVPSTGTTWVANMEGGCSANFNYDNTKKGQWQLLVATPTATSTSTNLYLYPSTSSIPATTGRVQYRNVMVTALPYVPAFVNGSRDTSSLEFNLNRDYQLDWSKDWSIVYWKKPVGTHTANLTGYSLDSVGCNGNAVGGGYIWWGKTSGSNSIQGASPGTIDPAKYFGTWRMISLTKTGTTLTIKEWEPDGTVHTRTTTTTNTVANYYVTQYGYDLKLAGWDNANACNTYFRDLIVAKRAFTDAELSAMYKTQMRATPSGLQLQKGMKENQIL